MNSKADRLRDFLLSRGRIAVALSGGLDSSVLLAVCAETLGSGNVLSITADAPYMMRREVADAERLAMRLGVGFAKVRTCGIPDEISDNPPDRCYKCKLSIFSGIISAAKSRGFETVADGTNADDLSDWRPGMRALRELGVASPFLECGLGKTEIRRLAMELGLGLADKPAYACLLTRLEHGTRIEPETLSKIDAAEDFLRGLSFKTVRVRLHGECARIETNPEDIEKLLGMRAEISKRMKGLGFRHVSLDLDGYAQGSMNRK